MRRIGTAVVILLLVAAWLAFWFLPPSDATRAAQLDAEIAALEFERSQVTATVLKRQIDMAAAAGPVITGDSATAQLLVETERLAQEMDAELVNAIGARLARLRAQRSGSPR